jgi:hypothetical protein
MILFGVGGSVRELVPGGVPGVAFALALGSLRFVARGCFAEVGVAECRL